jgi:hypothetical protein
MKLLANGVVVIGAASMGALRAAELVSYGMLGIGCVYESVKNGFLLDDSEVAVAIDEETHAALTIPLINIRHLLGRARRNGVPSQSLEAALSAAENIYCFERTERLLRVTWKEACPEVYDKLDWLLRNFDFDLKAADARLAIKLVVNGLRSRNTYLDTSLGTSVSELFWA